MKVSFIGFTIETNPIVPLEALISFIINNNEKKYKINTYERMLFCNSNYDKDYYVGVLITIKDQKSFCELESNGTDLKIVINEIDEKKKLLDFNFFIINKKTGKGLYQYYHHSCIESRFGYLLSNIYDSVSRIDLKEEINKINDEENEEKKKKELIKQIKEKYKFKLKWSILVRPEDIESLLIQYQKIKSFEFTYSEINTEEVAFRPLEQFIKINRRKFVFIEANVKELSAALFKTLKSPNILSGRVHVANKPNEDIPIDILSNPSNFGKYDYEEVVFHLKSLNLKSFEQSWIIKELLNAAKKNQIIFEKPFQE